MENRRTSRVSFSIFARLTLPEMVLCFFASAMVSASTFLMAEPLSRTAASLPESIMRTSWSAASPPPMFMFPHLLLVFFCFLDVLFHYRRLPADLPAELQLFPLCPNLPIHL